MRILTTACATLLIGALLVAYGIKEQSASIKRQTAALRAEAARLERELDRLTYEWRVASSPVRLERLAAALAGASNANESATRRLRPWRADQTLRLNDRFAKIEQDLRKAQDKRLKKDAFPDAELQSGAIQTSTIPVEAGDTSTQTEPAQ